MLITPEIVIRFEEKIGQAEGKAARLEISGIFQKLSSIQPLYHRVSHSIGKELSWDDVKNLVAAIPVDKQQRFSMALKYLQKQLQGHGSHMFETLRLIGTKVSKSQQRYMLPMLNADPKVTAEQRTYAEIGLCLNLSMLWLKEQFESVHLSSFERLADKNVMSSQKSYEVAKKAAGIVEFRTKLDASAAALGLSLSEQKWTSLSFERCADHLREHMEIRALLIAFYGDRHSVALFRENPATFLFFDANAGSYRVEGARLRDFLRNYNNVCLPKKWPASPGHPAYSEPATQPFSSLYIVDRLRR